MQGTKNQFSVKRIEPTPYVFSKEKKLGNGAFGQVYLGFDQKSHIPIAIKTICFAKISQSHINQETLAQKLAGELGNMQLARSQRLVRLISPHQSSKNMYIVCEYCNGGSLKQYLNKKGILAEFQALNFFKDILEGFKCLHEKRIVHRDMKPANLLIHNHRIKIGDLGFSKTIQQHEQLLTSIVGTPLYMSPQILSNSTYTEKTDIWSLGIILYEMLIGQAPWQVTSLSQIKQLVKYKPEFPRHLAIRQSTKQLILSMLQYEQNKRIGWQQLFQQYINSQIAVTDIRNNKKNNKQSQMQQQPSPLERKIEQISQHFNHSLGIQSQTHINYILQKNNIKYQEYWQGCHTAKQYFNQIKQVNNQQAIIKNFVNKYVQNRNLLAFLMNIFVECYQYCQQIGSYLVYTSMLMIIKYCIVSTENMLGNHIFNQNQQHLEVFLNSFYYAKFKKLLTLDLQILNQLFTLYYQQVFIEKIKQLSQSQQQLQIIAAIQRDLKPFFIKESASLNFTQFWLKNQCRQLFNAFKDAENIPEKLLLIPKMIYEYERSDKTHLFANQGQKTNIKKKIQMWSFQQQKWHKKMKQLKYFQIEDVNSFLSRQLRFRNFDIVGMDFKSFI